MRRQKLVSLYENWDEPHLCVTGIVDCFTKEQVLIKHLTRCGEYDGYAVRKTDNIFRVDFDGIYEQKLERLYHLQKKHHISKIIKSVNDDTNLFVLTMTVALKYGWVVNLSIDDSDRQESIIGWVKKVEDDSVLISQITSEGSDDGQTAIFIKDIDRMYCDTDDERAMGVLNKTLKKGKKHQ